MARRSWWLPLALLCLLGGAWGQQAVLTVDHGPNAEAQQNKHYVVLVSLDGFRYDYAKKYGAKHCGHRRAWRERARGMLPSYPSLTFPNHYTLVTGLYPDHHGSWGIASTIPPARRIFLYRPEDQQRRTWYGGTPLWSLAEKQGMRSACFFWPGSEAEIAGERPGYYLHFDNKFPDESASIR